MGKLDEAQCFGEDVCWVFLCWDIGGVNDSVLDKLPEPVCPDVNVFGSGGEGGVFDDGKCSLTVTAKT